MTDMRPGANVLRHAAPHDDNARLRCARPEPGRSIPDRGKRRHRSGPWIADRNRLPFTVIVHR